VKELAFSDAGIKKVTKEGIDWQKAPVQSGQEAGQINEVSKVPEWLKGHPRMKELLDKERDGTSFTTLIIEAIRVDYIKELETILDEEKQGRILHRTDKSGYQGLCENLAKCYHFYMHGANGKVHENKWDSTQREHVLAKTIEEGGKPTLASLKEWKVGLRLTCWDGEEVMISKATNKPLQYDLANLMDGAVECDPVAARLAASAQRVFRIHATVPKECLEKELKGSLKDVEIDVQLSYLPKLEAGEQWKQFYQHTGLAPFSTKCSTFWEGRALVPLHPFKLEIKAMTEVHKQGTKITTEQSQRIWADIFVGRPIRGGETKQRSADDIGALLNEALRECESKGFKVGAPTATYPKGAGIRSLSDAVAAWVNECAKEDQVVMAEIDSKQRVVSIDFPSCCPPWKAEPQKSAPGAPSLTLKYLDARNTHCVAHKVPTKTEATLPLMGQGVTVVRSDASNSANGIYTIEEKGGQQKRSWDVHRLSSQLTVQEGTTIAFLHPSLARPWKHIYVGKVVAITVAPMPMPVAGPSAPTRSGSAEDASESVVVESAQFIVSLFPTGVATEGVAKEQVEVPSGNVCFTKPDSDDDEQWQRIITECQQQTPVLHVLPIDGDGPFPAGLQDKIRHHADRSIVKESDELDLGLQKAGYQLPGMQVGVVQGTNGKKKNTFAQSGIGMALSTYLPPNPLKTVRILCKTDHAHLTNLEKKPQDGKIVKHVPGTAFPAIAFKSDAWDLRELKQGRFVPNPVKYTLYAAIGQGNVANTTEIECSIPIRMKLAIEAAEPALCKAYVEDTTVQIGENIPELLLQIVDIGQNVVNIDPPQINTVDESKLDCDHKPAERLFKDGTMVWVLKDVVFTYKKDEQDSDRPKTIKLEVTVSAIRLEFTLNTCRGTPHHLEPSNSAMPEFKNYDDAKFDLKAKDQYGWIPRKPVQDESFVFWYEYRLDGVRVPVSVPAISGVTASTTVCIKSKSIVTAPIGGTLQFWSKLETATEDIANPEILFSLKPNPKRIGKIYFKGPEVEEQGDKKCKMSIAAATTSPEVTFVIEGEDGQPWAARKTLESWPDFDGLIGNQSGKWTVGTDDTLKFKDDTIQSASKYVFKPKVVCPASNETISCSLELNVNAGTPYQWHIDLPNSAAVRCGDKLKIRVCAKDELGNECRYALGVHVGLCSSIISFKGMVGRECTT
jgi:hypothetical protein